MRYPFVMGNWKLNGNKKMVNEIITQLHHYLPQNIPCTVAIAPPTPYLDHANQLLSSHIALGAQNVDLHLEGAFTGETSANMLKDVGVQYVIVGHSERRTLHAETDSIVAQKFALLKSASLIPVLCIGETAAENSAGKTQQICARQLDSVINLLGIEAFQHTVIAYEPVWAIGTGKSATPSQAQAVHAFIRQHLAQHDADVAQNVTIQYGGSVNAENAAELFSQPDIDGALVGGASLQAAAFAMIVQAAAQIDTP